MKKGLLKLVFGVLLGTLFVLGLECFPAVSGVAFAQERVLYWGSRGGDVVKVQQRLRAWGYYRGPLDGVYGARTYRAVVYFQRRNGLVADGVVGRRTWQALGFTPGLAAGSGAPARAVVSRGLNIRDGVYLLARLIEGEAANEPLPGKVAVGAVVLNRIRSAAFPNTLSGVIFQPFAFESVSNGQINRPVSRESLRAAQLAMSGWDPTGGATFFWNPAKRVSPWIWSRKIVARIGRHVFAR